jgi:hypothetical protein
MARNKSRESKRDPECDGAKVEGEVAGEEGAWGRWGGEDGMMEGGMEEAREGGVRANEREGKKREGP